MTAPRITLAEPVLTALDAIAAVRGLTRRQAAELAVGFLQAAERARFDGLCVGATRDREGLERIITPRAVQSTWR